MERRYIYTSPFATPEPEPEAEPEAEPTPPRRPPFARALAAALVLVVAAAASGAIAGHALWPAAERTVTVATPGNAFRPGTTSAAAGISAGLVDVNSEFGYQGAGGAGTGIVVSADGRVVTNNHVISGATKITATDIGNGRTYEATVVGYDPSEDIAVLQLQGASGLTTATIGDSSAVAVGDQVVGVGNAGGVGGAPSSAGGTVTALDQSITAADDSGSTEQLSGLIQTNADIQPGDSGGALVDADGKVIGMNTAGSTGFRFQTGTTAAFAIPIDRVMALVDQIAAGKGSSTVHVGDTAFLGVTVAPSSGGGFFGVGATASGVTVGRVLDGKPAAQAGLEAGDMITAIGGTAVDSPHALSSFMLGHHPGDKVQLRWLDPLGASHAATVTLAAGPPA